MKKWTEATVEELNIAATANGAKPNDDFDDSWVQINGLWYRPGDGNELSA